MFNIVEILQGIVTNLVNQLIIFIPKLITCIVVLLIGFLIARLVVILLEKILAKVGIDKVGEKLNEMDSMKQLKVEIKLSTIIPKALYYFILVVFISSASEILGITAISSLVNMLVAFIPKLFSGVIMLQIGIILSGLIKNGVIALCKSFNVPSSKLLGNIAFFFFLIIVIITVLGQLEIKTDLLESSFNLLVGGVILAFSVGYGFASRDILANILSSFYSKDRYKEGQNVRIDDIEGQIIGMDTLSLTLKTKESTVVVLPLKILQSKKVEILN